MLYNFYENVGGIFVESGKMIKRHQIWKCDESGRCGARTGCHIDREEVHVQPCDFRKAENHSVLLPCINAAGEFGPPLIVYKGV
jgi:hypothetical protein